MILWVLLQWWTPYSLYQSFKIGPWCFQPRQSQQSSLLEYLGQPFSTWKRHGTISVCWLSFHQGFALCHSCPFVCTWQTRDPSMLTRQWFSDLGQRPASAWWDFYLLEIQSQILCVWNDNRLFRSCWTPRFYYLLRMEGSQREAYTLARLMTRRRTKNCTHHQGLLVPYSMVYLRL